MDKTFYHLAFKSFQINDIVFKIESIQPLIFSANARQAATTTTTMLELIRKQIERENTETDRESSITITNNGFIQLPISRRTNSLLYFTLRSLSKAWNKVLYPFNAANRGAHFVFNTHIYFTVAFLLFLSPTASHFLFRNFSSTLYFRALLFFVLLLSLGAFLRLASATQHPYAVNKSLINGAA